MNKKFNSFTLLLIICIGFSACGIYKFNAVNVGEAKTISIGYFNNNASLVEPTLSQVFTDGLRDYFVSQTNLDLISRDGDLEITGSITDYYTQPIAITGDETAALNRLTIKVSVKFVNFFDETKSFVTTFTQQADYDSSDDLLEVQEQLINEINEALIESIFNKAVVNW